MDTQLENLHELNDADLLQQIREDSRRIVSETPLDEESWDDPEEWQLEATRLAHAVNEWLNRHAGLPES